METNHYLDEAGFPDLAQLARGVAAGDTLEMHCEEEQLKPRNIYEAGYQTVLLKRSGWLELYEVYPDHVKYLWGEAEETQEELDMRNNLTTTLRDAQACHEAASKALAAGSGYQTQRKTLEAQALLLAALLKLAAALPCDDQAGCACTQGYGADPTSPTGWGKCPECS